MLLLGLVVVSCAAHGGPAAALPEPPAISLAATPPTLVPGEQTTWRVFWRNLAVGSVELAIDTRQARTVFRTGALASALSPMRFELVTALDHGKVVAATDSLTVDGRTNRTDVRVSGARFTPSPGSPRRVPGGTQLHTLHSALGVVRAWSAANRAPAGYLWVVHQGRLFRLDVFRPSREQALGVHAVRIDGVVRALDGAPSLEVTLWLAANRDRTPLRFVIQGGGSRVSAEVLESTASLDAR
ncbi:MAG: hypothetical protein H6Q90_78 [Deltaproteobacteria bacterium]|nr:hypothetical protein [Deltaproteobacteria bacterium]